MYRLKPFKLPPARLLVALLMVAALLWGALGTAITWAASDSVPQIHYTGLASGQQVYVQEIHTQPIVTIDTWVNTGSAQETKDNNGVSHFLEHLLFKGTQTYTVGEISRILESRGAEFNAATSDDFTHYHITTATPYFKEALAIHADMLLNATFDPEELDRERQVVQEEINRSLDNPARKSYIAMLERLFQGHPYSMDTLGPKANIQNIPREAIVDYYHRWYQPENFKTVVVGDVSTEDAVDMVSEAFRNAYDAQSRRPQAANPKLYKPAPLSQPKAHQFADTNLSEVQWQLAFMAPPAATREDNYALDIAAIVLGQGASSRLYQHVKEDKQLVNGISAANATYQQAGVFYVVANMQPENTAKAQQDIADEMIRFIREGPTQSELEKAKTQVIKQFAFSTESTEGVASSIGYNVTIGTVDDYLDYVSNIQKVSAEEVKDAARRYLDFNKAVLVQAVPQSAEGKIASTDASQEQFLQAAAAKVASVPANSKGGSQAANPAEADGVTKIKLKNGATVLLKPSPSTQTVAINMFAKGGRLAEPKPGVSTLAARVLLKGTKTRTSKEINQQIESKGLALAATSDEDYFQVSGASVSDDFDRLLLLMEDVLANPTFPQSELDKERTQLLDELKSSRDQPSSLMFEKLTEALYPNHPYGAVGQRLEAAIPNISREEIEAYYQRQMQPGNLVVSVVGNFDPGYVETALEQILDALPAPQAAAKPSLYPDVAPLPETVTVEAQKPEQAAAWIAHGWLAPGISTNRDYIALKVINTMLGSGLSSRLFVDLREKQGLAYHVSSMYPSTLKKGRFVMYIGTDPKNVEKVQSGFDEEIERLKTEPVTAKELEDVKSKLIGSFTLGHESNANQAFYLALYETLGVGYRFDTEYPRYIQEVTAQDIQRVAKAVFNQPKVVTVVAPKVVRSEAVRHED